MRALVQKDMCENQVFVWGDLSQSLNFFLNPIRIKRLIIVSLHPIGNYTFQKCAINCPLFYFRGRNSFFFLVVLKWTNSFFVDGCHIKTEQNDKTFEQSKDGMIMQLKELCKMTMERENHLNVLLTLKKNLFLVFIHNEPNFIHIGPMFIHNELNLIHKD